MTAFAPKTLSSQQIVLPREYHCKQNAVIGAHSFVLSCNPDKKCPFITEVLYRDVADNDLWCLQGLLAKAAT